MVPGQQLPQGAGVALNPVGAADDQNGIVQHLEGALHLRGEVHVPRCVQQGNGQILERQHCLLGEDRDAAFPLLAVGIQKGILVIHPAQLAQPPASIEQSLRQSGLTRVNMGQQTHGKLFCFHVQHPCLFKYQNCTMFSVGNQSMENSGLWEKGVV